MVSYQNFVVAVKAEGTYNMDNVLHMEIEPDLFLLHLDFLAFQMTLDKIEMVGEDTSFFDIPSCIFVAVDNNFGFYFYLHFIVMNFVMVAYMEAFRKAANMDYTFVDLEEMVEFDLYLIEPFAVKDESVDSVDELGADL